MLLDWDISKINMLITSVEVNLENKNAVIEYSKEIENDKIKSVIEDAGFEVIDIK